MEDRCDGDKAVNIFWVVDEGRGANARIACKSSDNGTWRSKVDVNVHDVLDAPIKTTSPEQVRPCSNLDL